MKKKIIIGTRGSKLALIYAQNAKKEIIKKTDFKEEDVFIKDITTKGDQVQNVRLSEVGGKGLFSSNIERELQEKKIDIAVHALKDMPAIETEGLITNTFLERNVLKVLEGDCETAVGAHAIIEGDEIILEAELFSLDGSDRFYEKKSSKIENAITLGKEVGQILKTKSNNSYKK